MEKTLILAINCMVICLLQICNVTAQNPCNTTNGNCSHICLWQQGQTRTCGCPCGLKLGSDTLTCIDSRTCNIDMFVGLDVSEGFGGGDQCLLRTLNLIQGPVEVPQNYKDFRASILPFLKSFNNESVTDQWNIGFQLMKTNAFLNEQLYMINVVNYEGNNYTTAVSNYEIDNIYACGGTVNYVTRYSRIVESNPAIMNYQSFSPGQLRNRNKTTSIGVIFTSGAFASIQNPTQLVKATIDRFDYTVIVTQSQALMTLHREIACGNATALCGKVFITNMQNDVGQTLTRSNFDQLIDYNICQQRQAPISILPAVTCGVVPTIKIPKCLLQGLSLSQMQFLDSSCNVQDFVIEDTASYYVIVINPSKCGSLKVNGNFSQLISTRKFAQGTSQLPNVNFTASCPLFTDSSPCSINNGNCSHFCSWSRGYPHICLCPCGSALGKTGYQCETSCDVDIYFGVDLSRVFSEVYCLIKNIPNVQAQVSTEYQDYIKDVSSFMETFVADASSSRWKIAIQEYKSGRPSLFRNLLTYQQTNFSAAVQSIKTRPEPYCNVQGGAANYIRTFSYSVPNNSFYYPPPPPYISQTAGQLRNRMDTVSIAILFTSNSFIPDSPTVIENKLKDLHENYYDFVVTVPMRPTTSSPTANLIEAFRTVSCRNGTAPCDKVIFANQITRPLFDKVIDYNACLKRRSSVPQVNVTCLPLMKIVIPKCQLPGVTLEQLQFNDVNCNISQYATSTNSTYEIRVDPGKCGINTQKVHGYYIFTQNIFTRTNTNFTVPNVTFEVKCKFQVPPIAAIPDPFTALLLAKSNVSSDNYTIHASLYPSYVPLLHPWSYVEVNCKLYFLIHTALIAPFRAVLRGLFATPTSNLQDPNIYYLLQDGCVKDASFGLLSSPSHQIKFYFKMFEFYNTFKKIKSEKYPVYFHMHIVPCYPNATSAGCQTPSCGTRRRRSVIDPENLLSFGPLLVEDSNSVPKNKAQGITNDVKDIYLLKQPVLQYFSVDFAYQWAFLLVAILVLLILAKKTSTNQRNSSNKEKKIPLM